MAADARGIRGLIQREAALLALCAQGAAEVLCAHRNKISLPNSIGRLIPWLLEG
jgi:hypothetical protein